MLDPIKATVITPGLDVSGKFAKTGIPASIVTKYLAEHGVIVEKTGLYSFFIMFTIGITKGRWNTLVTALQQFKDDYDKNQPLWKILPEFCAKQPHYERVGLRDLCQQIHDMYKANDVARVTTEMYLSDMQPAMKPSDAFACMAHREIDRVEIDKLEGRVTSVLLTPYPPGIPLLIPGERFNRTIVAVPAVRAQLQRSSSPASTPTSTAWSRTRRAAASCATSWTACGRSDVPPESRVVASARGAPVGQVCLAFDEYARAAGAADRGVQPRVDAADRLVLGGEHVVAPDALEEAAALQHVDDGGFRLHR